MFQNQKNMEVREQENEEAAETTPAKEQSFFHNPFIILNRKQFSLQSISNHFRKFNNNFENIDRSKLSKYPPPFALKN